MSETHATPKGLAMRWVGGLVIRLGTEGAALELINTDGKAGGWL